MSNNYNFEFKKLHPFKWFILENFPFLEDGIDALTNYQLFCKLGKEINKVIDSQNLVGEQVEELTSAFNDLYTWFENLDVQDEIDNKLDEMADDGTLAEIINQEIFGEITDDISALKTRMTSAENDIDDLDANTMRILSSRPTIFVGDSYLAATNNYGDYYKNLVGLNDSDYYKFASNGAGFYATGSGGYNFLQVLQNGTPSVTSPNAIKQIIVGSGLNDGQYGATIAQMQTAIGNFLNYCNTTFPNAVVYITAFGMNGNQDDTGGDKRFNLAKYVYYAYSSYYAYSNYVFIKSSPFWLKDISFLDSTDYLHPTQAGQQRISRRLASSLIMNNTIHEEFTINTIVFPDGGGAGTSFNITGDRIDNQIMINQNYFNVNTNMPASIGSGLVKTDIGTWTCGKILPTKYDLILNGMCYILANSVNYSIPAELILDTNGHIYLRTFGQAYSSISRIGFNIDTQIYPGYYA